MHTSVSAREMSPDARPLALVSSVGGGLPEQFTGRVRRACGHFAEYMRQRLLAASIPVAPEVMPDPMAGEVTWPAPRAGTTPDRNAKRRGQEADTVALGGRPVPVRRPRVRSVGDDKHEVALKRMTRSRRPTCSPCHRTRAC